MLKYNNTRKFVGLTHDNAASLSGEGVGLIGLLRRETDNYIFDIADSCHCLNLAMKHSLKVLPKRIMNFVEEIHGTMATQDG